MLVELPPVKKNAKLVLDPRTTAIIVVDMIKDFDPRGGTLGVPGLEKTIVPIKNLIDALHGGCVVAKMAGPLVYFVGDCHNPDDRELKTYPKHAEKGTKGAEVIEELHLQSIGQAVATLPKTHFDGFLETPLHSLLLAKGVKTLIVVGTISNYCVLYTAVSGYQLGYEIVVPEDCISSLDNIGHAIMLHQIQNTLAGKVVIHAKDIEWKTE